MEYAPIQNGPEPKQDDPTEIVVHKFSFGNAVEKAANRLVAVKIAQLEQEGAISKDVARKIQLSVGIDISADTK